MTHHTLDLWSAEPRELRASNLGPIQGEHHIGTVDGPGVYFLVAPNATGKSTELDLLLHLQDTEALKSDRWIRRGADAAYLKLEPAEIVFTRSPAGGVRVASEHTSEISERITAMPAAIETLIHGDHLDGDEARARRRLEALLTYAPVERSDERLLALLGAFHGSSIGAEDLDFDPALVQAWAELAQEAGKSRRLRIEPLRSVYSIRTWIETHQSRGPGVLDDHGLLRDIANATANTGEKAAEVQRRKVASIEGRRDAALRAALERLGHDPDDPDDVPENFLTRMEAEHDLATLRDARDEAKSQLDRLEMSKADREAAIRRQERLRETHGERPTVDLTENVSALLWALESVSEEAMSSHEVARSDIGELDDLQALVDLAKEAQSKLRSIHDIQSERRSQVERWQAVEDELRQPIEGATEDEVAAAQEALASAEYDLALAESAQSYQQAVADLEDALALLTKIDTAAKDLRAAARESWSFLGQIITESLRLPWLQVDGLDIYLGYVDGQLNSDPELIEEAQRAAEQAAAAMDNLSPVALPRFIFERIRSVSDVDWRLLDDDVQISTAELHEACLEIMLHRRGMISEIIVVPWQITAALDQERLERFDRQVREAEKVVLSERPRRRGDQDGMFLERVGGAQ